MLRCVLDQELEGADAAEFDRFVADSRYAAYQQTRAWAAIASRARGQDWVYVRCLDGERLVAAGVVRRRRLAPNRWLATIQRGPVVHDAAMLGAILPCLTATLADAGCCSVQLAPRVRGRDLPVMAEALRASGFSALPATRQPLHGATGIVWLDKPEAEILAGFKQRGRRQLKAAAKAGVTVRRVEDDADVAAYQRAIDAFRSAHPDYDMGGLPDATGQARLIAASGGAMLLAERDGVVIGGHAFVRQADEAIWLSLATSGDDPSVPRSYPLLWEGMRAARAMGCVGYDLAGMPVDEPTDAGEASRAQFKAAFAPTRRILPPMQVAGLRPVSHLVLFGARQAYRDLRRHIAKRRARG